MLTRNGVFKKLSDHCLSEDPAASAKVQTIMRNPSIHAWVEEIPVISSLLLTLLGSFEGLQHLVTKDLVWEYWSKTLVEEQSSHPDVTEIAELAEVETYVYRFGTKGLKLPINSVEELRVAYVTCCRRRFHR